MRALEKHNKQLEQHSHLQQTVRILQNEISAINNKSNASNPLPKTNQKCIYEVSSNSTATKVRILRRPTAKD